MDTKATSRTLRTESQLREVRSQLREALKFIRRRKHRFCILNLARKTLTVSARTVTRTVARIKPIGMETDKVTKSRKVAVSNCEVFVPSMETSHPFTYVELAAATSGFSHENLLGEGGFGRVYKGTIAGNQVVAVKQLTVGGGQGEREFRAEVDIISRVHHRHLVSLVGYCIDDRQRLLVYDFVSNGTLDQALHGKGRPVMDWATRMKVARGSARGLAYLHEDCHPRIFHRDIKSSNILLDSHWEAQVADFGLAKVTLDSQTHVTTRVMGTFGYLAPEYALIGKLTDKSDVYSFGVVLLELITGRKPVDLLAADGEESLVEWARPLLTHALEDKRLDILVDPRLENMYNEKEMFRMIELAAACVRHSSWKRPKMVLVARALESSGDLADLYQGTKPGHSNPHSCEYSGGCDSSEMNTSQISDILSSTSQINLSDSFPTIDITGASSNENHMILAPLQGDFLLSQEAAQNCVPEIRKHEIGASA